MSERDDGSTKPPDLPVTSPDDAPPVPKVSGQKVGGWQIATGVLALTTVGALAWGVTQTNDLQAEVDRLQETFVQQEADSQAAIEAVAGTAEAQVDALDQQVAGLSAELAELEEQAGDALEGVAKEYTKVQKQVSKTERFAADLQKELDSKKSDAAAVAEAYGKTLTQLYATQDSMVALIGALVEDSDGGSDGGAEPVAEPGPDEASNL
jgi:hypothetical protein